MTVLVVGAWGSTGKKLVEQLLAKNCSVKIIVRSLEKLPESWKNHNQLLIKQANLLALSDDELLEMTKDCDAIASCLGHNMSLKGIFGKPRKLVTEAVQRLTFAAYRNKPNQKVKFVLMNTVGHRNRDLSESISFAEKCVIGLFRFLVPPQSDNEQAAEYLRLVIGNSHPVISWVVVRPDSLLHKDQVSEYTLHPSPTRSAIFNPGKTSRINVAHFMARLLLEEDLWKTWKGQMPVIYNRETSEK